MLCVSGLHEWADPECAKRCCNGYARIMGLSRQDLVGLGCEHITARGGDNRGVFDGWLKEAFQVEIMEPGQTNWVPVSRTPLTNKVAASLCSAITKRNPDIRARAVPYYEDVVKHVPLLPQEKLDRLTGDSA